MANFHSTIGIIAGVVSFIPIFPYVSSILKGKTKPNRASWVIWFVVGLLLFSSYWASGAHETIWVPLSYVLFPAIILPLAFKYGEGGFTSFDIVCLIGALTGAILWYITKDPVKALYINAAIDIIGFFPTIRKTYLDASSESKAAWIIAASSAVLNMFAVTNWSLFQVYMYPIYLFVFQSLIALLCFGLIPGQRKVKV